MPIYFISGLGADERVFQFLKLPATVEKRFIAWVDPYMGETLTSYSKRLIDQIDLSKDVILLGVSFGGIVAQEIAQIISVRKTIIISSVKSPEEFGIALSLARISRIHKVFPARFLKWSNKLTADYFFGTKSKEESKLLHQIVKETNDKFMTWAIDQIMKWSGPTHPISVIHIHGANDRIFPMARIRHPNLVLDGGHFIIVNKALEISRALETHLSA